MHNFREWLSDNLRYIMLIIGILILLVLIFVGIRAITIVIDNGRDDKETAEVEEEPSETPAATATETADTTTTETATPTPTPSDTLEENAYPEINTLISSYYTALGNQDVETLKTLVDDLDSTEEAKVENAQYIDGYSNVNVYTKPGLTDDSYVVLATYDYNCDGISTPVPALSQLYVQKEEDSDSYQILQNTDEEVQDYVDEVLIDSDVQELIGQVESEYEAAKDSDKDLEAFLDGLGDESDRVAEISEAAAEAGTAKADDKDMITANDYVYVRSGPNSSYGQIGSLAPGDEVERTGVSEGGLWYQINYNGQTGYVYAQYIS